MTAFTLLTLWFTLTNHFMRGITYGVDIFKALQKYPTASKIIQLLTGKYTWCVYSGLLVLPFYGWEAAIITTLGLWMGIWKGAEFTILHKKTNRLHWFLMACIRGVYFLPLFFAYWWFTTQHMGVLIAGLWCALMYAVTSAVFNPFYHDKYYAAEAHSQTLFGLVGLGLPIAYALQVCYGN
jgi:hypothetical protein